MYGVLALIAVGLVITLGFGSATLSLVERWNGPIKGDPTLGDVGLVGLIVLAVIGTALNFGTALSPTVTGIIAVTGLILFLRGIAIASRRCAAVSFKSVVIGTSLLVSLSVIVADHTYAIASQHYDSGLYHLQSIIQITESPVVLGIANLHMRFGYNSLWFVDAAILTIPGFGLAGAYLPNPLIMIFVVLATVQHVQMALKTPGCFRSALFGLAALLVFLNSYFLIKFSLGSPNTDVPSNLLIIYAAFLSLLLSDKSRLQTEQGASDYIVLLLTLVVVFAVTIKLSVLPLIPVLALLLLSWHRGFVSTTALRNALILSTPLIVLWLARGIATSGCLAYPSPDSCLPVPWRISLETAQRDVDYMRSWPRLLGGIPEIVLADWTWLPGWIHGAVENRFFRVPVMLIVISVGCLAIRLYAARTMSVWQGLTRPQKTDSLLLFAVSVVGVSFWFLNAPAVRYATGWIVLPLLLLVAHIAPRPYEEDASAVSPITGYARLLGNSSVRAGDLWKRIWKCVPARFHLRQTFFGKPSGWMAGAAVAAAVLILLSKLPKPIGEYDFPRIPVAEVETRLTRGGLQIQVPKTGDQCWAAPRPCAPYFSESLELTSFGFWSMMRDPGR
jgi:hypothetical protein